METITVRSQDEFVSEIVSDQIDANITPQGAEQLWEIWSDRREAGADNDVLVVLPPWYAEKELGRRWPYIFAQVEFDNSEKKAVLFDNARMIDVNVVENRIWDNEHVTMTETLEIVDITDDNDYIDEQGKLWIPRSLMAVFRREDSTAESNLTQTTRNLQGDD